MNRNFARVSGTMSIVQSVLYVIAFVAFALTPPEQLGQGMANFASSYSVQPLPITIMCLAFVLLCLLGMGGVSPGTVAFLLEKQPDKQGWLYLGRNLALLALAVIATYYIWFLSTTPERVSLFLAGNQSGKDAIAASSPNVPLNWVSWFVFGMMGVFVAINGAVASLCGPSLRVFVYACVLKTGGFWLALWGVATHSMPITVLGGFLGGVIGAPMYHYVIGVHLIRRSRAIVPVVMGADPIPIPSSRLSETRSTSRSSSTSPA